MSYYEKELSALKKVNRFRERKLYKKELVDLASNDYLGLSSKKKLLKKVYKKVKKEQYFSPKASMIVNGYSNIHKKFEKLLCKTNEFEDAIALGSGFLANISLLESLARKRDVLFIDEEYHASGILASKLSDASIVFFNHNDTKELENKIKLHNKRGRVIIAIEGVYSMGGDIAPKEFVDIANRYDAILIVDEAHSSGVIGKNLLGWYDYHHIKPEKNHIKMGTLGKAYGSYGAYILASNEIISYLENRAKPIIYSTAPSLFDIALAYENLKYILKHKKKIQKKIQKREKIVKKILGIKTDSLIVPIVFNNNQKVLDIQKKLIKKGYLVGAIRQPTVKQAIIRMIIKLDIKKHTLKKVCKLLVKPAIKE
ncbi:MAG: pyridoxal phosphate-dependent aminotransferase family protein [Campylobacterota bacterium]|nr:pyridoxal phosphate-dependent aminotransferase family protein [Campylobacterota bacterium]